MRQRTAVLASLALGSHLPSGQLQTVDVVVVSGERPHEGAVRGLPDADRLRAPARCLLRGCAAGGRKNQPSPLLPDLFTAIRAQDLAQVAKLLTADPSLAAKTDDEGVSPIALAMSARKGVGFVPRKQNRVLDALLRRKPPLSPFETAGLGTAEEVRALAKDPDYVRSVAKNGWTPLHYAAFNDDADAAAALLDAGADVNARQADGITALHEAAQSGDPEIIRMLLAAGAAAIEGHAVRTPPAYVIAEVDVTDRAAMHEYGRQVPETLAPFEGRYRYLVRGGKTWALEGEPPKGIVVIAFDSAEEARRWYDSPAYAAIRPIRKRASTSRIFLVEGVTR